MKKSVIILAGGASNRVGKDKGLLDFKGKPLINWVIEAVKPLTGQIYVVCSGKQASAYDRSTTGVQVIKDLYPEKSPLIGLISGLKAVKTGYAFITACDMPFIKTELVSFLFEQAKGHEGSIIVKSDGWIEPFLSVLNVSSSLTEADRLYRTGDYRLRMVMRNLLNIKYIHVETVREIDPNLSSLIDIDTLQKLRELESLSS